MMIYISTIDFVPPTGAKVLVNVIAAMERDHGLLGTLEAVFV
jgi:hypothetical protein